MGDRDTELSSILKKRWLRDRAKSGRSDEGLPPQEVFVPEDEAPPARRIQGFELCDDGSYLVVASGSSDACEVGFAGTWRIDEKGRLVLEPEEGKGTKRVFRLQLELIEEQ